MMENDGREKYFKGPEPFGRPELLYEGPEDPEIARPPGEESPPAPAAVQSAKAAPGVLELIYGTLFDPVKTLRRIAESPPLGKAALIFSIVKVLSVLVFITGGFFSSELVFGDMEGLPGPGMEAVMRAVAPVAAVLGLAYEYVKWFIYSGVLYLLAELLGGRGKAAGVLASTGLASLPALLFLPVQILLVVIGGSGWVSGFLNILIWLAVLCWGAVLVVIGLRETQRLSTGRALVTALAPPAGIIVLFILILVLIIALAVPLGLYFEQFADINY